LHSQTTGKQAVLKLLSRLLDRPSFLHKSGPDVLTRKPSLTDKFLKLVSFRP
jgi:hypothetical protein